MSQISPTQDTDALDSDPVFAALRSLRNALGLEADGLNRITIRQSVEGSSYGTRNPGL
jgi:hypothetical protein